VLSALLLAVADEAEISFDAVPVACPSIELAVLPGKALAATAVNTPVKATLPPISQRLMRASLRRPASLVLGEWCAVMQS